MEQAMSASLVRRHAVAVAVVLWAGSVGAVAQLCWKDELRQCCATLGLSFNMDRHCGLFGGVDCPDIVSSDPQIQFAQVAQVGKKGTNVNGSGSCQYQIGYCVWPSLNPCRHLDEVSSSCSNVVADGDDCDKSGLPVE